MSFRGCRGFRGSRGFRVLGFQGVTRLEWYDSGRNFKVERHYSNQGVHTYV